MIDKEYVLQLVLSKLKIVRVVNGVYHCICPKHQDNKPSLHVSMGNIKIILDCKAGCDYKAILDEIGLKPEQLYYDYYDKKQSDRMSRKQYGYEKNCIDKYPYFGIDTGLQNYIKYRLQGKKFPQGYDKNGQWTNTLEDIDTSLSVFCNVSIDKLKQTAKQEKILHYTEGEKDCKTIGKYGLIGFTCGSKGDWMKKREVFKYVKDALLIIFSDNDAPGITSSQEIKAYYEQLGSRAVVIIPPGVEQGGDISDYMETHTKEDLYKLIDDALSNTVTENRMEDKQQEQIDLMQFHHVSDNGKISGVFHNAIFEYIKGRYNIFVCGGTPYIYSDGFYKVDVSGARLKSIIRQLIYPQFIKSTTINNIYTLFLQDIELEVSFDELNKYPSYWICFRNGMYDTKTKELRPHSPKYRAINQIPHKYDPNAKYEGTKTEEYLHFICEEQDSREMLLQFFGYTLTKDISQQKFLMLSGEGGSGKSTVIRMIEALTGSSNISNISLTDLQQRFASFGLMGKLLNSCADLEISALEDTSIIKKILGEDSLRAESKGKDAISFKSYAKLIFSTNELPLVKSEKTNGFYRRLLVLTMNKVPLQKNPNLFQELLSEVDYLLQLSVQAVERMYQQGTITVSESSERAVLQLRADSDSTEAFLQEFCVDDEKGRIERTELYNKYNTFCGDTDRQSLTKNNFYKSLRVKGYCEIKTSGYRYFKGINYKENCSKSAPETALDGFVSVTQEQLSELPFD